LQRRKTMSMLPLDLDRWQTCTSVFL